MPLHSNKLIDKFNIIENHITDNHNIIISKLNNHIENELNSNTKMIDYNYINQLRWFNDISISDFLSDNYIKNILLEKRNTICQSIMKDNFDIIKLTNFIDNYISKLERINTIFLDNNIIINGLSLLETYILNNQSILQFLEDNIIKMNKDNKKNFINFYRVINKIKLFSSNIYNSILNIFTNSFIKNIMEIDNISLPENLKEIQLLDNYISYYNNIIFYYNFIQEIKILAKQLVINTNNKFFNIINSADIDTILFLLENYYIKFVKIFNIYNLYNDITNNYNYYRLLNIIINIIDNCVCNNDIINIIKLSTCYNIIYNNIKETIKTSKSDNFINNIKKINKSAFYNYKFNSSVQNTDIILNNIVVKSNYDILIDFINTINGIYNIDNNEDIYNINGYTIIIIRNYIKEQDIFATKYYHKLIEKLTNSLIHFSSNNQLVDNTINKYIKNEMSKYKILFGDKEIEINNIYNKICKIINDTESSYNNIIGFNKEFKQFNNLNFSVMTISHNKWDINIEDGLLRKETVNKMDTHFSKLLDNYINFYENKNKINGNKTLFFYPQYGEVVIQFMNQQFKMLPIQYLVLEMFENTNSIKLDTILEAEFFKNYSNKFKKDIINSFISANLFVNYGDSITNDNIIILQTSGNFNNNLIDIYYNLSNYNEIIINKLNKEIIHNRIDIINCNINSLLKINSYNKDELYNLIKNKINLFIVKDDLIDKSIEYLIKNDYINISNIDDKIIYNKIMYKV
jgi:hypothetical protein